MKFLKGPLLTCPAVPYAVYLLLVGVFWLPYSRQLNADGVSYLSIASAYAAGDWPAAVNTYWSPLFSWLVASGIALKAPPLVFARLLLIAFGLLGLFGLQRFLLLFELHPVIAGVTGIAAAPMFCYFALHDVTPDVLALALLLFYLTLTCKAHLTPAQWTGAGALGALLYLAKAYCLVFVFAQLLLSAAIRMYASRDAATKRRIARRSAAAMTMLVVLSAPWLVVIARKAGRPTLSTAGSYNFALAMTGPSRHPMLWQGLFAPPSAYAVSVWEDPDAMHLRAPTEPAVFRALASRAKIIAHNLAEFARYQFTASFLAPVIVILFAFLTVRRWRAGKPDVPAACLLGAYLMYPAGYFLTFAEHRYIWIEDVMLLIMCACVFDELRRRAVFGRMPAAAGVIVAISFCWAPLYIVVKHRHDLREVADLVPALRRLHMSGNMASNARWDDTQYLAYVLGLRYYGMPAASGAAEANESALVRHRVRFVFVWHRPGAALPAHPGEKLLASAPLDVYELPPG